MTAESTEIACDKHGPSKAAYVCEHLCANPEQRWYCDAPREENPCPDAWCSKCNVEFLKEGEWNENNERFVEIKVLCQKCYEDMQGRSVDCMDDRERDEWSAYLSECIAELREKQAALERDFKLGSYDRWDWDQEQARLVFSHQGKPVLVAPIEFVGTLSTHSDTWMWSWANFSLDEPVRSRIGRVREYGEEQGFPRLLVPLWEADQSDGWQMTAVAARLLNARGAYRTPGDYGFAYMLMMDVAWSQ